MSNVTSQNVIVSVSEFGRTSKDKNGEQARYLSPLYGKMPSNGTVMSGTFAQRQGLEIGKMYSITVSPGKIDPVHGQQYNYTNKGELSTMDEMLHSKTLTTQLGVGQILEEVPTAVEADGTL